MTTERKGDIKVLSLGTLIIFAITFGAYINTVKSDKSEVTRVEKRVDEICVEQKEQRAMNTRIDKSLSRIETILEQWEKEKK
jgi:hypothetical protein